MCNELENFLASKGTFSKNCQHNIWTLEFNNISATDDLYSVAMVSLLCKLTEANIIKNQDIIEYLVK